jgi:hypothetical protein
MSVGDVTDDTVRQPDGHLKKVETVDAATGTYRSTDYDPNGKLIATDGAYYTQPVFDAAGNQIGGGHYDQDGQWSAVRDAPKG